MPLIKRKAPARRRCLSGWRVDENSRSETHASHQGGDGDVGHAGQEQGAREGERPWLLVSGCGSDRDYVGVRGPEYDGSEYEPGRGPLFELHPTA